MGNPKKDKDAPRIIVKNAEPQFAANEFFALRIAALLGMPVSKARFMRRESNDASDKKFSVGIECMDLFKITDDDLNFAQARKDFIECNLLHICFSNTDKFQMAVTSNGHIIPFDFAECFHNSSFTIMMLLSNRDKADKFIRTVIANNDYLMRIVDYVKYGKDFLLKQYQDIAEKEFDETVKLFARKIVTLSDSDIIDVLTPIEEYYSKEVADYYDLYLGYLQKNIQGILS